MPRYITLDEKSVVIGVRNGSSLVANEIENEVGEIGEIMQLDGTFIDNIPVIPQPVQPTNQEIKDNQMTIMNGLTDIYMKQLGF